MGPCGSLSAYVYVLAVVVSSSRLHTLAASFYGESFVELKTAESFSKSTLHLKFRTSKPDGLLFLAAGKKQYSLLELHSGHVQGKIDFGEGEQILLPKNGPRLDDLEWHVVKLHHENADVVLSVDQHINSSLRVAGGLQEFSVHYGLYVGGFSDLDVSYAKILPNHFRGCLDEVVFNNQELLSSLRPYPGLKNVHEVSLGCSDEFFVSEDDPMSLFSSKSYVVLPPWTLEEGGVWECLLQSSAGKGLLLYQSGSVGNFISLEIQDYILKAHLRKGNSLIQLSTLNPITEHKWHHIKLKLSAKHFHLTLDEETVKASLTLNSKIAHLNGPLFVGGVNDAARKVLISSLGAVPGKHAKVVSFKGCIKNIKVNSKIYGLKNALATKDVSPGCKTEMLLTTSPVNKADEMHLNTAAPSTSLVTTTTAATQNNAKHHFIVLNNLVVQEGGRAPLQSKHIKLNLDFKKLGVRQSQITFKIVKYPQSGQLKIDVPTTQNKDVFTMLDLWHGRITYIHDGSEGTNDNFTFTVTATSKNEIPFYLDGTQQHLFSITVTPTNDAPELSLPEGNLFVLLENSKKRLPANLLKVSDVDTDPQNLNFVVLGNLNADAGFLVNGRDAGKGISIFSYSELLDGNIFYVHHGVKNSRLVLRVSDGDKVSNTVVLRILAVPLDYKLVNNTGIVVTQGESTLILTSNLGVDTNAENQDMEIRYDVMELPKYGQIQRRSVGNEWKSANSFTQRSLERERIRYLSTFNEVQEADGTEYFKFKVTIANKSSEEYLFPISVQWLKYTLVKHSALNVENRKPVTFTTDNIFSVVTGISTAAKEIYFKVLSLPKKGRILVNKNNLKENDMFSQVDITDLKVEYELTDQPRQDSRDFFSFSLFTKHAESKPHEFQINIKADLNSIFLTNNGLSLAEGDSKLITRNELFVQTLNNKTFSYKVQKSPQHGKLRLINFSDSVLSNDNITAFSSQDILGERLMYAHDDTETTADSFTVLATSLSSEDESPNGNKVHAEVIFNISIELKNDEKPIRMVDKLFHVVRNGQRLVTLEDLCYHDSDTDFTDGQLLYTRRGIPNGDLVSANDPSTKLYQFTQEDLEKKRVLFMHQGSDYGRFVLFVTDGKHYTSSLLEVSASEPYVKVVNNTGLLVQKGKEQIITISNISIATNLYIESYKEIVYNIASSPKYGKILVQGSAAESFTHLDIKSGHVTFRHDDSNNLLDAFNLTVTLKNIAVNIEIKVRVYLESHQRLPTVLNLNILVVEQGRPVKIDERKLQVVHEDNLPKEIIYSVISPPSHGYIRKFESVEGHLTAEKNSILTFTQQDINDGLIHYVQSDPGQLQDNFTVDITNGIRIISGITVSVDIIPLLIPLATQNITVKEGASKALTDEQLNISNKHFAGLNFEFEVIDLPKNGYIENTRFPGIKLNRFTRKQVEQELIYYVHDDSETLNDNFTILVNDTDLSKHSLPSTIFVTVSPINDEFPFITANSIFRVWVGSVTEVTCEDLCAKDKDTSPSDLVFSITPPSNGHLALKSYPNKSILNFTQQHIDDKHLVFVHSGSMSGGFNFQVTDGLNFAPRQIFSITARTLVINLEANKGLDVFPGTRRAITSDHLKAVTNDESNMKNRTVTFTVVVPPKHGLLMFGLHNATEEVSGFSQLMVDEGVIFYEHTDNEALLWNTQDSFTFTASSPPAFLESSVFLITISYEINDPARKSRLRANTGASVEEGGKVLIDKSKLDGSNLLLKLPETQRASYEVWYQVTSLPNHGMIIVGDRNITKDKPNFSQYIVNKFGITYMHDGSESLADRFTFATWLNLKSKSAVKPDTDVLEEMFNFTIIGVNDQSPELKTKRPYLKVLQGQMIAIGSDNLNVEDLDNPPEDIKYTIISTPNNGFLANHENLNASVDHFTQADINDGHVWFVQDGSTSSGVFYFSVTDGKHKPLYKLFNIDVTSVSITLVNQTNLVLTQSQTFLPITNMHLAATTDGRSKEILYEVVQMPTYGQVMIDYAPVTKFGQIDLNLGKVKYHVRNLTESQDSFELMAMTSESNLTGLVLNVTLKPLVHVISKLEIPTETIYIIQIKDLDASELANVTGSDPEFHIIDEPGYGRLMRRKMPQSDAYEDIAMFTQAEIETGRVLLEVSANLTYTEMQNDSFSFLLKASNVPPALGVFSYSVVPNDPLLFQAVTSEGYLSASTTESSHTSSVYEKRTPNYWLNNTSTVVPNIKNVPKWGNRNRWGNQNNEELLFSEATTSSFREATVGANPISPKAEASQNGSSLSVIIPLVILVLLILAAILIVWFLMKRKTKKAPQHVKSNSYSVVPQVPSPYMERSATIPTVTVTPLQKSHEYVSVSPLLPPRQAHTYASSSPSLTENAQQNSWLHMDPEMLQHCRTTNPTLKNNQYWV
ncbi:hypothetical protein XENTR_v10002945 [Xenopus tropicalis]|uniref:Chondroitin sulfate proteoglycan 4 n=1 Tax=Xenopus tropicalis TaxID=8364 RepID=F6UZL8_XENTR|nr:chondroitin sulfate proteoglycan 4 [Xenopus tropicalis]KAE8636342.1 hypothetical protein XENTR_v10002945 [Xenopus tropicalis]